jgi:hypothetical protein
MRALQKQYIVDVFVWIDDLVTQPVKRGQQPVLKDSELLTILIWDGLTEPHKNLSSIYSWIEREYADCFPRLPKYQNFVAHCHRLLPTLVCQAPTFCNTSSLLFGSGVAASWLAA